MTHTSNITCFVTVIRLALCLHFTAFSALTRLGGRKGIRPEKMGGWWRWALFSPDGVAPSRMVGVSASVNLPLHHKVQKFSPGTGSPGWSRKKGRKTVVVCGIPSLIIVHIGLVVSCLALVCEILRWNLIADICIYCDSHCNM